MQLKTVAGSKKITALRTVPKPWGITYTLYAEEHFRINLLSIKPKKGIAAHYHTSRSEIWAIAEGTAEIQRDDSTEYLSTGHSVIIPPGLLHKIKNNSSKITLQVLEIQMGNSFGKDDIIAAHHEKLTNTDQNMPFINKFKEIEIGRRPWGEYQVIHDGKHFKIKVLKINPNQSISKQLHNHRQETWMVVQGTALTELNHESRILGPNRSIFIPNKAMHRIKNPSMINEPLIIVEVQTAPPGIDPYFGEDDIYRFSDQYGRK
jgi:mannose-6-phosphate isomerase-like protein (cupin superfamily)